MLLRWTWANAIGELVGLGLGAVVGVLVIQRFESGGLFTVIVSAVLFAVIEGFAVGMLQHRVLVRALRFLTARRWVGWTMVGALVAWLAVSIPMTLMADAEPGPEPALWIQLPAAIGIGLVAGPVLGVPQAIALKEYVARPWRWVWANSLAWAAGMPLIFLAAGPAFDMGMPAGAILGAMAILLAGAVVGLIHGSILVRMIDRHGLGLGSSSDALAEIGSIDLTEF